MASLSNKDIPIIAAEHIIAERKGVSNDTADRLLLARDLILASAQKFIGRRDNRLLLKRN
jgi:hypothetical protein